MLLVETDLYRWRVDVAGNRIQLVEKLADPEPRFAAFITDGVPDCYATAEKDDAGWAACKRLSTPVVGRPLDVVFTTGKAMAGSAVRTITEEA